MSKNLKNDYIDLLDSIYYDDIPEIVIENKDDVISYLTKIHNCSIADIRFVYIPPADEIAIYVKDQFKEYYDQYFILEMDRYNIDN